MVPSDSEDDLESQYGLDGPTSHIPPTIYIIKFHPRTRREAVEWLLEKIEAKQKYGGAELFLRCEPQKQGQGVVVHVSATKIKLLEVAEATELQKMTASGLIQEFSVKDLDQFLFGVQNLDNILTSSEREYCVRHELDNIRSKPEESCIPGYPEIRLYPGQSLIDVYQTEELVTMVYPLHDRQMLESLASKWYKSIFQVTPLEDVRAYFGESVAMYFSFLGFYTLCLLLPASLGVAQMLLSVDTLKEYALFAALNVIWVTLFLEFWKRRCASLAYSWGLLDKHGSLAARPEHKGEMKQNPITGRFEPHYPLWKTRFKVYFVSAPFVCVCMFVALYIMVIAFWAEEQLIDWKKQYGSIAGIFMHLPSAAYAVVVWVMNFYYRKIATLLTSWVATMLIVTQMINHFQEALLPYIVRKAYEQFADEAVEKLRSHPLTSSFFNEVIRPIDVSPVEDHPVPVLSLDPKDPRVAQAKEEASLDFYEDVYDDYLEIFLQFGYVFLFSSVYPMAAFWAVLNNVLELKTDAFKLCRVFRRPKSKKVCSIGVWQSAFELLGAIAVMTNCALLWLSPQLRALAPGATAVEWVLLFVLFEHLVLGLKFSLMSLVPDQPKWIRDSIEKVNYQSKLALRNERSKKTRRHLSRRFRSVHGMPRSGSRSRGTTPVAQNGGLRHRSPAPREYNRHKN